VTKPDPPFHDATRWFVIVGIVACIIAAVPLIFTLVATLAAVR
jgi:hypothetical protein